MHLQVNEHEYVIHLYTLFVVYCLMIHIHAYVNQVRVLTRQTNITAQACAASFCYYKFIIGLAD